MADLNFECEVRTPYSEAYLVMEQDRQIGRVDIHFTPEMVHVAVSVDESLTQETFNRSSIPWMRTSSTLSASSAGISWCTSSRAERPAF